MGFIDKTPEGRYRAYFRDPSGKQRSKSVFEMSRRVYVIMVPESFTVDRCQDAPVEAGPAVPGTRRI
jgi:hypothetical protein